MAFSSIIVRQTLDWITASIDAGKPTPSPEAIADRFGLASEERAKALLAELADAGSITIDWKVNPIAVTLGRKTSPFKAAARPLRSVTKAKPADVTALDEEAAFDRIKAILARGKAAVSPAPVASVQPSIAVPAPVATKPEPVSPAPRIEAPGARDEGQPTPRLSPAPVAPQPVEPAEPPLLPAVVAQPPEPAQRAIAAGDPVTHRPRQINIKVAAEIYDDVARRAEQRGISVSTIVREIFMAAYRGHRVAPLPVKAPPAPKLRIPAGIVAAATRDGIPVLDLAATLLARGLRSYEADAAAEMAA